MLKSLWHQHADSKPIITSPVTPLVRLSPILSPLILLGIHISLIPAPSAHRVSATHRLRQLQVLLGNPKIISYEFLDHLRWLHGICHLYPLLLLQPPPLNTPHPWDTSTLLLWTSFPPHTLCCSFASQQSALNGYLCVLWTGLATRDFHWHTGDLGGQSRMLFWVEVAKLSRPSHMLHC